MKQWKCTVCGYIHTGEEPPEKCPVCKASKDKFVAMPDTAESVAPVTGTKDEAQMKSSGSSAALDQPEEESSPAPGKIEQLILENHLHPISVHSPNGIIPMAVLFLVVGVVLKSESFFDAAYYSLVFTLLAMPPVMVSGFITWKNKYNGAKTSLFTTKIAAGSASMVMLVVLVIWKTVQPEVLSSAGRWPFLALAMLLLGAVGLAGHLGGKLVFSAKD